MDWPVKKSIGPVVCLCLLALITIFGTDANAQNVVVASPQGYTFTVLARLGDPAPGGDSFTFAFDPFAINNGGEFAFTGSVTTGEAVFAGQQGQIWQIARVGQAAPGGGTFGAIALGRVGLNNSGDLAFAFTLEPLTLPLGLNSGVYRFSQKQQALSAVVIPNVTPAPGGGVFAGTYFHTSINNSGDIVFSGIVTGADIDAATPPGYNGIATGLFRADKSGRIFSLVRPGDAAPGGVFDDASNGWINDGGDVAFGGHVAGEECIDIGSPFVCGESVYLRRATTGAIDSIAHQGDPAPGGGTYRLAFGPVVNNRGDIAFIGDLTPPPASGQSLAVFLFSKAASIPVARPGTLLPGGGTFVTAGFEDATYHLNNRGDVSFAAALDTDLNGDGIADSGLYVYSQGKLRLVARTGTTIPGLGTIAYLGLGSLSVPPLSTGGVINEAGQVLFFATLSDGTGVLLVATPY